ncbi:MAG: M48 family metallopeptidase, partial [Magnetococcales bacterium]|nr:M48 family metallopeptidase [Magnetococcales bacterium]
ILSPRTVRHANIRLGQALLNQLRPTSGFVIDHTTANNAGSDRLTHGNHRLFFWVVIAMATVALGIGLFYQKGIPGLARHVAFSFPEKLLLVKDRQQGAASLDRFSSLTASQLGSETHDRVRRLFARIQVPSGPGAAGETSLYQVFLRHGGTVGANAFAFPNGTVVVTDELVSLVDNDEELQGILAHELGHLEQRHGLRIWLQRMSSLLLTSWVTGDVSFLAKGMGLAMHQLMTASYSQEFELEADQKTIEYFRHQGIPIRHFVHILEVLSRHRNQGQSPPSFLSTHPSTTERIRRLTNGDRA